MPASERLSAESSVTSSPAKEMRAGAHAIDRVAHDDVPERGLAGTVGAHEDVALALADGQVDLVQDGLVLGACREGAHVE